MSEKIQIVYDDKEVAECSSAILVPEAALNEPGYIKTITAGATAHSKHEFHAMAQMVFYQYQDEELDVVRTDMPLLVRRGEECEKIESGMVVYRDMGGEFHVLIHSLLNAKKMLEITNRYCTRWVRLDI